MNANLFCFADEQWPKVEPHLPSNQQGADRHDDRRILSGIMHVQMVGCRWKDCPREYGPHKTIYNRFARWSERGIWQAISRLLRHPLTHPGKWRWTVAM
jgi:transposase